MDPSFSEELSKYPGPPKDNESGTNTTVLTNYSRVELSGKYLYVYQVSIINLDARNSDDNNNNSGDEQIKEPQMRSALFARAQESSEALKAKHIYFDGNLYAYSAKSLHKHWTNEEYKAAVTGSLLLSDLALACQFEVGLRMLRRYEFKELQRYCAGNGRVPDAYVQGFLYALDGIIRSCLTPQFEAMGGQQQRRRLSSYGAVTTQWGFDVWWEYRLTMRPGRGALFVNVGAKSVAVVSAGIKNLAELSSHFFSKKVAALNRRQKGEVDVMDMKLWASFEPVARGIQVTVPGTEAAAGVARLSAESAGKTTIGNEPVADYYQREYGLEIGDPSLPCAVLGDGRVVPLLLCRLQAADRRQVQAVVAPWQRDDFMQASAVSPAHRVDVLAHGMRMMAQEEQPDLRGFGIKISADLETVNAQVLGAPQMMLRSRKEKKMEAVGIRDNGRWEMAGQVVCSASLRSWSVVVFGTQTPALVRAFVVQFVKISVSLGIDVQQTAPPTKHATAWNDVEKILHDAAHLAQTQSGERAQLVMCILPFSSVALYGEIKRVATTLVGVHTQCVQASHVRAHCPKLLTSVALKVNVKLGGFTACLDPANSVLHSEPTMILSADVNHTTEAGEMSVAAVVSSTDVGAQRFAGTVLQHPQRMEFIENLDVVVRQSLRLFYARAKQKPRRIVYYRDGVSDAQMQMVKQLELAAIYRACQLVDPQYRPKVTVVLVRKRHHSRFVLKTENCVPGTCVSEGVVSPHVFSFYLLAHQSPFGVSRPAYYLVLHDDCVFGAQALRELTYSLSFLYPIVTRSVTMPASLYYAHRLTGKGRLQLSRAFHTLPHFGKGKRGKEEAAGAAYLVPVHKALRDSMYFM
ncbi:hypothetical protein GGI20_001007 [Coemansia sp. BCRC 34301]|nr:hypothetical protein GGI20_001007 [Coemansia sp. BCRC 34301]